MSSTMKTIVVMAAKILRSRYSNLQSKSKNWRSQTTRTNKIYIRLRYTSEYQLQSWAKLVETNEYRKIPVISPGLYIQLGKGFWMGL